MTFLSNYVNLLKRARRDRRGTAFYTAGTYTRGTIRKNERYTGNEDIVFEGTSDKENEIFLIIISLREGERATSDFSIVEASELPYMIAQRIPIHKTDKDKILVLVTDTKDGYDHSFDPALADMIKIALQGE